MRDMRLNEKIEKLCLDRGWKQADLARIAGISRSSANKAWQGTGMPSLEGAMRIARALDVSLDYLADDEQDETPQPAPTSKLRGAIEEMIEKHGEERALAVLLTLSSQANAPFMPPAGSKIPKDDGPKGRPVKRRGAG